ncbi:unnamed protein product, partial [Closterium sp. NIES-53]
GSLHEEIWLRRPPGITGSFPPGTQWSLRRPVYGLRQAPREWHDTLRTTLAALGFAPSTADPSLFLRTDTSLPPFFILVYVDDLVFATADTAGLTHVKSELQKGHTCTDPGELRSYLGLQITRDRVQRTITLTQSHMVQQVLQRFDFTYSSPQATPLSTRHSLSALPSDESVEPSGPYPELVGCLMYVMTCTRPDFAYPLSILARYVAPGRHRPEHMAAANTSGMGLVLGGRRPVVLTGHADASWADDQATQRSSQGYTFSLGSGSVSWRSTRSSSVLSSSCGAEIYAGAMAAQELRWLTYLLTDLGEQPRSPPVLYVDNKAMLALCREHRLEHMTKHIALRYFLARELQQRGQLRLAYVASEANTADIFTKALPPGDHQRFCTMLACFALIDWSESITNNGNHLGGDTAHGGQRNEAPPPFAGDVANTSAEELEAESMPSNSGEAQETESVDEEYEGDDCGKAKVSGSNLSVCTSGIPMRGGVRGPLSNRSPRTKTVPAVDAALAARLRARERELHDLRSQMRNPEAGPTETQARCSDGGPTTPRPRRSALVVPDAPNPHLARDPPRDAPRTPFVARALARETVAMLGRHGAPTTGLIVWADTLESANSSLLSLDNGWKVLRMEMFCFIDAMNT